MVLLQINFQSRKRSPLDSEILSTVSGFPLDFSEEIHYKGSVASSKCSLKEEVFLSVEIKNVLYEGNIKECQHEEGEYIFPIFLTPKSHGPFRIILNLKKLNDHMPYIHTPLNGNH